MRHHSLRANMLPYTLLRLSVIFIGFHTQFANGVNIAVSTILDTPYVRFREVPEGETLEGNERFEGFVVDILDKISEIVSVSY